MSDKPVGPVIDGLGVTLDLDDDDLVTSALVVAKVIAADGTVSLFLGESDGLCWIDRAGLLSAAQNVTQQVPFVEREDEV